jgi:hypothetical protein
MEMDVLRRYSVIEKYEAAYLEKVDREIVYLAAKRHAPY